MTNTFNSECKLINLKYEYKGYTGDEKWAVISELSEKELLQKYPDEMKKYVPFVRLSIAQGKAIYESLRNDNKFKTRNTRYGHAFDIGDGEFEIHHAEFAIEDNTLEQVILNDNIQSVRELLNELSEVQKRRVIKYFFCGQSSRSIAKEEGVNYSAVDKSIALAIEKLKKLFEMGVHLPSPSANK